MAKAIFRRISLALYLIFIFVVFAVPLVINDPFWLNRLSQYVAYGILAMSMCLCWGYAGILSLGHGAFFGIGAYSMAMSLKLLSPSSLSQGTPFPLPDFMVWNTASGKQLALPFFWVPFQNQWFGVFAALVVPAILAAIIGWFVFYGRVSGVFLSIITLSLGVILNLVVIDQQPYTNGFNGLTDLASFKVGNIEFDPYSWSTYILVAGALVLTMILLLILTRTKVGLLAKAIQADEVRVMYFGYDIASYKLFVFTVSALVARLAGALFVICSQFASPALMDVNFSIAIVVWVAVGGRESLIGATVGAITINLAQGLLSENQKLINIWQLIIGIVFVLFVIFLPKGLAGLATTFMPERVRSRKLALSSESASESGRE